MPAKLEIKRGDTFGRLTVMGEAARGAYSKRRIVCKCSCGAKTTVLMQTLKRKNLSCGCYAREAAVSRFTTHGLSGSGFANVHRNMLSRCYDSDADSFHNYGARGIRVCRSWRGPNGLTNFVAWNNSLPKEEQRKAGLLLDRVDGNLGYSPSNCRWVTPTQSNRNKKDNIFCSYKGRSLLFVDAYDSGHHRSVSYRCALARFTKLGWCVTDSLHTPIRALRNQ